MKEVFAVQKEICQAIATSLRVQLGAAPENFLARRYTSDPEVYELYLHGRTEAAKRNTTGVTRSRELFEHALRLDPGYAPALAGLAQTLILSVMYELLPAEEGVPKARDAARQAIRFDPELADAYAALAWVSAWYDWDQQAAESQFQLSLDRPGSVTPRQMVCFVSVCFGTP